MRKAFTIIELLVVILVLTIIFGLCIPLIKGMMNNAKLVQVKTELNTLVTAVESYYTFSSPKAYPPTTATLCASYLIGAVPNMVSSVLHDPFATTPNTEYQYMLSANGKYYIIWSVGLPGSLQPTGITNAGDITF